MFVGVMLILTECWIRVIVGSSLMETALEVERYR